MIAAAPAALLLLLSLTRLPDMVIAAAAIALLATVTGAFHEDGLGDIADGFGGGATQLRKLEIMKDSRIGAFAAVAIGLALALRIGLLAAIVAMDPWSAVTAFLAAAAVSRTLPLWIWTLLPAARVDGLAASLGAPGRVSTALASLAAIVVACMVLPYFGVGQLMAALGVAALATLMLGRIARRQIGGQTGDVLGAAQQVAEIGFFAGLLL
ncbi:adenosylcobinamide-GDP ribazoletransferase [Methylobrevis pamukkalensis]|uniref:Adenosylcobinamide-GDP ribazoletransferase n=1 Tax=Methylobrevis pamukkalensis TaxID=1439726 RepID=A0A1E3GYI9_9HYPH|nr:adenosylcobinamide-GDP ribazoletransferase [Methylobrevis pamukkalensis]ODN69130.1 Cobalamin synthase [Methylobrevis pamukkalensis]